MRAIHKYKNSNHPEAKRRIAQSMGYRMSIWDMPQMVALCQRAGLLETVDLSDMSSTTSKSLHADTDVVKL